ncbi:MAG: xylulokinase [Terrimicrobiaceae bacterium]
MITIGIDCGTQSTKVVALDWETGSVLAAGGDSYGFVTGLEAGAMEQDPAWWTSAADKGMREVITTLGARKTEIAAIGVSGQQHGFVPVDRVGNVIRPAKLWCDTSTTEECEEITAAMGGEEAVVREVGNSMRTGYTAPKVRWLAKNEPANWEKTAAILLPHDYLNFWLSGEQRMEFGDASGTALMDVTQRKWSQSACQATGPGTADKLPPVGSSASPVGRLRESLRQAWGLESAPLISAGGGDNMMAAIGTGNVKRGAVTASLGTSGTLFAFSDRPVVDPAGEVAAFCDSTDHWLPLVCTMNLTLVSEHIRGLFAWSHEEMDASMLRIPAGCDGLTMLPYLTGERTPDLPAARGFLAGLTLSNFSPGHMARCAVESVILGLAYGLQRFRDLGVPVSVIRLTGGASQSPVWRQICADAFGVPTVGLDSAKGAALGAAIQSGWSWSLERGEKSCLGEHCDRLVGAQDAGRNEPGPDADVYAGLLRKSGQLRSVLREGGFL